MPVYSEELEAWNETIAILSDTALLAQLEASNQDVAAGRVITLEEFEHRMEGQD